MSRDRDGFSRPPYTVEIKVFDTDGRTDDVEVLQCIREIAESCRKLIESLENRGVGKVEMRSVGEFVVGEAWASFMAAMLWPSPPQKSSKT